jgi:hypothetical protein
METNHSRVARGRFTGVMLGAVAALSGCTATDDQVGSTTEELSGNGLRDHIAAAVGGLDKLTVPADDNALPVPAEDPLRPGRYQTTEAKRYLGKLLFHDPVRTARININTGQPIDLPPRTAFGGTLASSRPEIGDIVADQKSTGSCGSCHFGEAATKAGDVINLHVGAEGRGYTDEHGAFIVRRRVQSILPKLRTQPLFPGDALVDALPTLTDIFRVNGQRVVTTPALFYHSTGFPGCVPAGPLIPCAPPPEELIATGRLDNLDSVGRLSMSVIGFAYNNRLLFGGFAGEPATTIGSLNPFNDPAGENITLLLLDAHRMLSFQSAELLNIPAFVKLFKDAFPAEAAEAEAANDLTKLVNDVTVFRATATFLRTVVTRNTPFDRFLAGDNRALTARQRRGARLFFTEARDGGAGCFSCHSGPMLNKQANDPDAAGIGAFVEENFVNVGIGDHPLQALNAVARNLSPATRGLDTGREEITRNPDHAYKFRSLTLRQLKDARNFFHNGSFSSVRDVVRYFNEGVPQDPVVGAAATLDRRFTRPRGDYAPRGLGLSEHQIDALADFVENGLYDPAFVEHDPSSTTRTFQPNADDLAFSQHRPDLAALGAVDGKMLSGLAIDNNDPLSRRDAGLEFLDVTAQVTRSLVDVEKSHRQVDHVWKLTNTSTAVVDTHLLLVVKGLPAGVVLRNASGTTAAGEPYIRIFLPDGTLKPDQNIRRRLAFRNVTRANLPAYTISLLSGQGTP